MASKTAKLSSKMQVSVQKSWANCNIWLHESLNIGRQLFKYWHLNNPALYLIKGDKWCWSAKENNFSLSIYCVEVERVKAGGRAESAHLHNPEVGIYKRKQENTLSTKKVIRKTRKKNKTRSRPRKRARKNFPFINAHLCSL